MASEFYTYKQENKVSLPLSQSSFIIDKREWERLKKIVSKCKTDEKWFKSIAFCFFGISGSAFITYLSLITQKGIDTIQLILLIVAAVALIIGGLCIGVQYFINNNHEMSIQMIKDELTFIEKGVCSDEINE